MTTSLPRDVIGRLTTMNPELGPDLIDGSWAELTPFHEQAGYRAPQIKRDLRYGGDERNRLDVHTHGTASGRPRPVPLFVHGGGFVREDKIIPGTPQYDFVAAWQERHGTVPNLVYVPGHNHISEIGSLGVDEPALGTALARFIDRQTG